MSAVICSGTEIGTPSGMTYNLALAPNGFLVAKGMLDRQGAVKIYAVPG
jgi:hypothetical protein